MIKKRIGGIFLIIIIIFSVMYGGKDEKENREISINEDSKVETTTTSNENDINKSTSIPEEKGSNEDSISRDVGSNIALSSDSIEYKGITYEIVEVYGGDLSGERLPNVAVDVGFGDRVYWAFTNDYGQLVNVIADYILLQDDNTEPVNSDGRYFNDEAKVPGTELKNLDEGHVIMW